VGDDDALEGSHQRRIREAVECSSPLPLRTHPVHISKAGVVGLPQHPLRVIVLLGPGYACHVYVDHVQDLMAISAPCLLDWPPPGLSNEGSHSQVGSQAVLEDAAVYFVVFEDGLDAISHCRSKVIVLEVVGRCGEVALRQLIKTLGVGGASNLAFIDERPSDEQVRGDVIKLP
jgi:hypothetical protein